MQQIGFFALDNKYASLAAKHDPLLKLNSIIPWENFRGCLEAAWRKPATERWSNANAGRKPLDAVLMFKVIMLASLYNLADEQMEFFICDRLTFMRFLGLGLGDEVPDVKTIWMYRDRLADTGVTAKLFADFADYLQQRGYAAKGGQIIDASIVTVPRQHNKRDENETIKAGKCLETWSSQPAKSRQQDIAARWVKNHGKSWYGYKNHSNVDRQHKLVRVYHVTAASVHASQVVVAILDKRNTASDIWADKAYRAAEIAELLRKRGLRSHIQYKAYRNKPLGQRKLQGNKTRARVRARVEHIFGSRCYDMGGTLVRSIGLLRVQARIGLKNLAYNMRSSVQLKQLVAATQLPHRGVESA